MGRVYYINFEAVAATALQDLFEILAGSGKDFEVLRLEIMQTSDVGDAAEEILGIQLKRAVGGTSGSGGSTATPVARNKNDSAAGVTAEINNTTPHTSGTVTVVKRIGWNVRQALDHIFMPEDRPYIHAADRLLVALPVAPADSLTVSGCLTIAEY